MFSTFINFFIKLSKSHNNKATSVHVDINVCSTIGKINMHLEGPFYQTTTGTRLFQKFQLNE